MEATLLTSETVDTEYRQICSQIGQLVCRRDDVESQLAAINGELAALKLKRVQAIAQFHALQHNEKTEGTAPLELVK